MEQECTFVSKKRDRSCFEGFQEKIDDKIKKKSKIKTKSNHFLIRIHIFEQKYIWISIPVLIKKEQLASTFFSCLEKIKDNYEEGIDPFDINLGKILYSVGLGDFVDLMIQKSKNKPTISQIQEIKNQSNVMRCFLLEKYENCPNLPSSYWEKRIILRSKFIFLNLSNTRIRNMSTELMQSKRKIEENYLHF